MYPVINIGPLTLPTPAFLLIIGYFAGSYLLDKRSSSFSVNSELLDQTLWIGTLSALLGARLSYIAASPAAFKGNILSIFSLNPALLDPVGGFVIGAAAVLLVISRHKTDIWNFLDSFTLFLGGLLPAYFLSRFSSGDGYGLPTDLPWGIYLWGALRHPVQIYLTICAIIILVLALVYAPLKGLPAGSTFLLFTAATSSYLLFFSAFQEPVSASISGFRSIQIVSWLFLLAALVLLNLRIRSTSPKAYHEINK